MKLQLALDTVNVEEAILMMHQCQKWVDIIEIGTPMLIEYGLDAVRKMKQEFPEHLVLADAKIMDAGELEANMCFLAGADIVTVLGVSHPTTIANTVKAATKHGKMIMVDMIDVEDIKAKTKLIDKLGVDFICVHTAFDLQGEQSEPLAELEIVNQVINKSKSAVAGGVKLATIENVVSYKPDVIVVGGGITNQDEPAKAAQRIKEIMEKEQ